MYYDPCRELQALPNEAELLRHTDDERKFPFDSTVAVAQPRSEREAQRVMDGLLRECLRRRPLLP
jgi:hypothetical protein